MAATLLLLVKAPFYPKTIENEDLELQAIKYDMIFTSRLRHGHT